ncbi:hypothetical protein GBAR_LOCUS22161 [Geodia barretti]|uniref:Uncharacterized protein n=1 Tax=Geodia barretti TaxID=519541 RepID=A0AA35T275_GEOBA|nr:hypothetical protein GBAR_LOCUS22161 [Geodia barretti]
MKLSIYFTSRGQIDFSLRKKTPSSRLRRSPCACAAYAHAQKQSARANSNDVINTSPQCLRAITAASVGNSPAREAGYSPFSSAAITGRVCHVLRLSPGWLGSRDDADPQPRTHDGLRPQIRQAPESHRVRPPERRRLFLRAAALRREREHPLPLRGREAIHGHPALLGRPPQLPKALQIPPEERSPSLRHYGLRILSSPRGLQPRLRRGRARVRKRSLRAGQSEPRRGHPSPRRVHEGTHTVRSHPPACRVRLQPAQQAGPYTASVRRVSRPQRPGRAIQGPQQRYRNHTPWRLHPPEALDGLDAGCHVDNGGQSSTKPLVQRCREHVGDGGLW